MLGTLTTNPARSVPSNAGPVIFPSTVRCCCTDCSSCVLYDESQCSHQYNWERAIVTLGVAHVCDVCGLVRPVSVNVCQVCASVCLDLISHRSSGSGLGFLETTEGLHHSIISSPFWVLSSASCRGRRKTESVFPSPGSSLWFPVWVLSSAS